MIRANAIQAIIFDFGGVISVPDDEDAWRTHKDAVGAALGFESGTALWYYIFGGEEWWLAKTGQIGDDEFWRRLLEPLGLATLAGRREWVRRLYGPFGDVHPRMRELLGRLKGRYKLALLSNASDWLGTALSEKFQLDEAFDVALVSALVGLAKPDPAIYELTLERLGTLASQTLFIDDQARNTQAAEALGIPSIVFPGVEELWTELAARGLL
jgi:epoxide hydrolase-like predicted phosphatase